MGLNEGRKGLVLKQMHISALSHFSVRRVLFIMTMLLYGEKFSKQLNAKKKHGLLCQQYHQGYKKHYASVL